MRLIVWPIPLATKKKIRTPAAAIGFLRTHAEEAIVMRVSSTIQSHEARRIAAPMKAFDRNHRHPSRYASKRKRRRQGAQVIRDIRIARTQNFPRMYSRREKGRHRYSARPLFARSGEMSAGPMKRARMNASQPWIERSPRKNTSLI